MPRQYNLAELRAIQLAFERLAVSLKRLAGLQNPALTVEARRRTQIPTTWRQAREAFESISTLLCEGDVGYYDMKYYTVDKDGCRAARLNSNLVSDLLRQLWRHVAWLHDTGSLASNVRVMCSLEPISAEILDGCKRLAEIIQCEQSRNDAEPF